VPRGRSITAAYYIEVLKRLRENVAGSCTMTMRPVTRRWQFSSFLAVKENHTHAAASLYSPDLAPCDFWLFPKLKTGLRSCRIATVDDIKENAEAGLRSIKKKTILKNVSKLGKTDGASVCVQKEGTLKVIRSVSPTVHSIYFYSKIPETF
jgi:hypothetical protein